MGLPLAEATLFSIRNGNGLLARFPGFDFSPDIRIAYAVASTFLKRHGQAPTLLSSFGAGFALPFLRFMYQYTTPAAMTIPAIHFQFMVDAP
jgi:hypothetical protein